MNLDNYIAIKHHISNFDDPNNPTEEGWYVTELGKMYYDGKTWLSNNYPDYWFELNKK